MHTLIPSALGRRLSLATAVLALAAGPLVACGDPTTSPGAGDVSLVNCGRTVALAEPAKRGITLNQGATESALAVGAGPRLVGTAYLDDAIAPQWKQAYDAVPVLAAKYPGQETVLEKKPDLLLASYSSAFTDKGVGGLDFYAERGVGTYVSPFACADKTKRAPATWESIEGEITDYGVLFGRESDAEKVVTAQRTALDDVRRGAAGRGRTVFWYDSNTTTPFVGAGQGGPQLILDAVGAKNIFADLPGNWADAAWEAVIAADPDVIVLADATSSTADAKRRHLQSDPVLRNLRAVRAGAFVVVPFSATTPGPRTVDGARTVAAGLASTP